MPPTHSMTAAAAAGASLLIIYLAIRRRRRLSSSFLPTQSFGAKHEGLLRDARLDKLLVITRFKLDCERGRGAARDRSGPLGTARDDGTAPDTSEHCHSPL